MAEKVVVCGKEYSILRLLGHGKGGYSYLAEADGRKVVVKKIHHEPCDYYTFGNKIEAERTDYERLWAAGIRMPEMIAIDIETETIVKEYIEGDTVFDCVRNGISVEPYIEQVREMAVQARAAGLNIDYFPTNFVVRDGLVWYVDYECNDYMKEWNFENWGIKYWSRTPEFEEYMRQNTDIKKKNAEVTLALLTEDDREQFIRDNQDAFNYGALMEFGLRDDHYEEDGEIISHDTIDKSINGGEAYRIIQDGCKVGGVVIKVDGDHGDLELLFVSPEAHSKGIGYAAWCEIERMHPEVKVWETATPYFEKRNIHFYVNRCGFHIVEFFNAHHPDPRDPDPAEGSEEDFSDGMFRFVKVIE